VAGAVARAAGLDPHQSALVLIYTTMTGSATAGQRLLALDPGDVALLGVELTPLCESTAAAATADLADMSDPLLDVLAQRHELRPMPLFAS
jgi:urease accessory protein